MAAVVEGRNVKRKQPRVLGNDESLDTLTPWKAHMMSYFRDDGLWGPFANPDVTWNTTEVNWGFQNVVEGGEIVYTATQKKLDCSNFLHEITCLVVISEIR